MVDMEAMVEEATDPADMEEAATEAVAKEASVEITHPVDSGHLEFFTTSGRTQSRAKQETDQSGMTKEAATASEVLVSAVEAVAKASLVQVPDSMTDSLRLEVQRPSSTARKKTETDLHQRSTTSEPMTPSILALIIKVAAVHPTLS